MRDPPTLGTPDGVFESHPSSVPDVVSTAVTSNVVEEVASKLLGAAGPGNTDSEEPKNWLLHYGENPIY